MIRKLKSEIDEQVILKVLDDNPKVVLMEYIKDFTNENITTIEQLKQNKLNCVGVDLMVETVKGICCADMKVLKYYNGMYGNKPYNGNLTNDKYGVERLIFQVEGKNNTLGWANNRYKQCDVLLIYIKQAKKIYSINYKKLVKWIDKLFLEGKKTECDYIVFKKGYGKMKTRECVISIPTNEIPNNVINKIYNVK